MTSLRSPCLKCPRLPHDKRDCADDCEPLDAFQRYLRGEIPLQGAIDYFDNYSAHGLPTDFLEDPGEFSGASFSWETTIGGKK